MSTIKQTKQTNNEPKTVKINTKDYFSSEDLNNYDTAYFTGTHRNLRGIVKKKNIPESAITYAYVKDNKIVISTESYVRAKLYLEAEWVYTHIPKMIQSQKTKQQTVQQTEVKSLAVAKSKISVTLKKETKYDTNEITSERSNNHSSVRAEVDNFDIESLYDVPPAPEVLELSKDDMFKDADGNVINIEVRGEREHTKCYFKVKDIMKGFDMAYLNDSITHKDRCYIEGKHYKYFTIEKSSNDRQNDSKIVSKKELFLTYNGILKVLFSSKSGNAEQFQNWASETLFVHQMGTIEQKQTLSASLLGLQPQTIKDVFNSNSNKTPTVYLVHIGSANQLLKTNTYSEDDILCKFGCTEDISRRLSEHDRNFKKQYNTEVSLMIYSIIDPKYIFDAENNIKQFFRANKISSDDKSELIVINKKDLGQIKQHYKMIQNSYIGRYEEMNKKIIELEKQILELNHTIKLKDKDIELKDKDIQLEKQKNEILEMKLMMLKFQTSNPTNLSFHG